MENEHINYFKVENFKKFDSFEMDNIGQFNLIVGDNNVGKTTLLEALTFSLDIYEYINNITTILDWRKYNDYEDNLDFNFFKLVFNNINNNTISYTTHKIEDNVLKTNSIDFTIKTVNDLSENEISLLKRKTISNNNYKFIISSSERRQIDYIHDYLNKVKITYLNFIPHFNSHNDDLIDFFSNHFQSSRNRRVELINSLKLFVEDLENIEISSGIIPDTTNLIFWRESFDQSFPINQFGEGTVRFFRIILEILICKNRRLMVDEIDSGIHFSKLKNYFKKILEYSLENNTQIFATTHSKECIQYFQEAIQELDVKDKGRIFSLSETKEKQIKSYCFTYEEFEDAIRLENEIR